MLLETEIYTNHLASRKSSSKGLCPFRHGDFIAIPSSPAGDACRVPILVRDRVSKLKIDATLSLVNEINCDTQSVEIKIVNKSNDNPHQVNPSISAQKTMASRPSTPAPRSKTSYPESILGATSNVRVAIRVRPLNKRGTPERDVLTNLNFLRSR